MQYQANENKAGLWREISIKEQGFRIRQLNTEQFNYDLLKPKSYKAVQTNMSDKKT